MATDALTAFLRRDFAETEQALLSLRSSVSNDQNKPGDSSDDLRIEHNLLIAGFYAENSQENLDKLLNYVIGLLPQEKRPTSLEDFFAHSRSDPDFLKHLNNAVGPVALFNIAVIAYHQGYTKSAANIGELLYANIEALDDWLALRACFLLTDVYLRLGDRVSAARMAAYAEKLHINFSKRDSESGSTAPGMKVLTPDWRGRSHGILEVPATYDDAKFCTHVYNARLSAHENGNAESARGVRKEAKNALIAADNTETRPTAGALLVKARVEQNYSKSFRILASILAQSPPNILKKVRPLMLNTLGVLHHRLGRHALAACYFEHSRKALDLLLYGDLRSPNIRSVHMNVLSSAKDTQVSYNLALQYMKLGDYARALELFVVCARCDLSYANDSALMWLRMAECCIGIESNGNGKQKVVFRGQGRSRRLLMQKTTRDDRPLMQYAATCARATVAILDRQKNDAYDSESQKARLYSRASSASTVQLRTDQMASRTRPLSKEELDTRAAALSIIAYASLAFDPVAVIEASDELQRTHAESDRCELARLYSAEAYCMLGRSEDAANRIAPLLPGDNPGDSSIREMAYVNMALTHVCKGNLEAGSRVAKLALKTFGTTQKRSKLLQRQTIFATSYIFLRNNEPEMARRCLRSLITSME